ncbi:MAG: hypothetical protein LH470_07035, partial [Lysobacter sp.]|nr:hypothetical protein [Lysobacter sp.]
MKLGSGIIAVLGLLGAGGAHAQSFSKTETIEYHDNMASWVLGQVKRSTTNGIETSTTTYDAVTALPMQTASFGKVQQMLTYNANGTVATVKDGNNNVATLSNWKRGIPQTIQFPGTTDQPSGATRSAVVNDQGWIDSVTDEAGYKTCYQYDLMGRMRLVTYPSESQSGVCDASTWTPTIRAFAASTSAKYGLPVGHWQQIVTTGSGEQRTYYDALWRPVVTERYDNANPTATRSVSVSRYDADGQPVFQSYPMASLTDFNAVTQGARTYYDALNRVTRIEQDSEQGVLATTKVYDGIRIYTTNPRNQQTIVGHRMYDQPSYDLPHGIIAPEDVVTEIYYDSLDKPYALRRTNGARSLSAWRYYDYDAYKQLCRVTEPETGATVMGYDGAGNLAWSASGLSAGTPCDGNNTAVAARKASRTYDARNRLKTLTFPDGLGNQTWTYTPDNMPVSITTHNDGGNQVVNGYSYNKRRLLTGESVVQPGWYSWSLGYVFDINGSLAGQSYPTGLYVDYAPNALGQPTRAGSYATNVSYHPNGGMAGFTYGNGLQHGMVQNARQLPASSVDTGGALNHLYQYDPNGNVTHIGDQAQGDNFSRWMYYDGLDRLTDAGSCSFGGNCWHRFTYDALDNIKSWTLPGVKDYANYNYEPGTNRLTLIQNTAGAGVVGIGYDVQGNVTNKNGKVYAFDFGNRLRQATGASIRGVDTYRYDGHGRRIETIKADGTLNLFQYSQAGQMLFGWKGPTQETTQEHVYLNGSLVATIDHSWPSNAILSTKYQHTDALGSPVAVTNEAGQVIDRTQYEPFGAAIGKPAYDGIGYTGHVQDGATGLTYMQQRYYDPQIG